MRICELTPHSFIVEGENVTLLRYVFLTIYRAGDFRSEVFLRERAGRMELLLAYRGRRGTPDIRLHGAILHQSGGGAVSPHRRHSDRSGTASGALVGICFLAGAATVAAWASCRARCDIRPFVAQCCARAIQVFDLAGESGLDRILVPQPPSFGHLACDLGAGVCGPLTALCRPSLPAVHRRFSFREPSLPT